MNMDVLYDHFGYRALPCLDIRIDALFHKQRDNGNGCEFKKRNALDVTDVSYIKESKYILL